MKKLIRTKNLLNEFKQSVIQFNFGEIIVSLFYHIKNDEIATGRVFDGANPRLRRPKWHTGL